MDEEVHERRSSIMFMRQRPEGLLLLLRKLCVLIKKENRSLRKDLFRERINIGRRLFLEQIRLSI